MHVGGTAVGVHAVGLDELPLLVVSSWSQRTPGGPFLSQAMAVAPPETGAPCEAGFPGGTALFNLSSSMTASEPVASCDGPNGVCVLVRELTATTTAWSYRLRTCTPSGPTTDTPVPGTALLDPSANPYTGNLRMASFASGVVLVSSEWTRLRVAVLPVGAPPIVSTFNWGRNLYLRGLTRVRVASVRVWGSSLSIALTVERNDVRIGSVSQGMLLRLIIGASLSRDSTFGTAGSWLSPVLNSTRDFISAGEVSRGLAGVSGDRIVVFGVSRDGQGLDPTFGEDGVAQFSLGGGTLSAPVGLNDRDENIYVFAQRAGTGDIAGARIMIRSGFFIGPNGSVDPYFGQGGIARLSLDGATCYPCGGTTGESSIYLGVTRAIQGADCQYVPVFAELDLSNGAPVQSFGAGGFALQGSLGTVAALAPDGSAAFLGSKYKPGLMISYLGTDGSLTRQTTPSLSSLSDYEIEDMARTSDGSLLLSGSGWIAKVTPSGQADPTFGTGGVAWPILDQPGIRVLGERADGKILIRRIGASVLGGAASGIALLNPDGSLDMSYGDHGLVDFESVYNLVRNGMPVEVPVNTFGFLQPDGSASCVLTTNHDAGDPQSPSPTMGLRRVDASGNVDMQFGIGLPNAGHAPPGTALGILGPTAADEFAGFMPAGLSIIGNSIYVVATGLIGPNVPYPTCLVVTRWNLADGRPDPTYGNGGWQQGGFSPDPLDWAASGVLPDSTTSFLAFGSACIRDGSIRQAQPAVFRIGHPAGIDFAFGNQGAATIRMQEFGPAAASAGVVLPNGKVRLACADTATAFIGTTVYPLSTFGGLAQLT